MAKLNFLGLFEYSIYKEYKSHLFETEIFCNIINVIPVTSDKFNTSLSPKFWTVVYLLKYYSFSEGA